MRKIQVLVVAGSYEASCALEKIVTKDTALELVGTVNNAYAARDKIIEHEPDIMLMTSELPRMSGIVFLQKLIPQYPIPVIVLGPARDEEKAYNAKAKGFILFDESMIARNKIYETLLNENIGQKIKKLVCPNVNFDSIESKSKNSKIEDRKNVIIAMGASTGGTEAIATVIRGLKKDIPGIVMVQHMPEGFTQMYANRLDDECEVNVKEARTGDVVVPGQVLLAPGDKHMKLVKVNGVYQVECRMGPKVSGHCPSVDVLFESVAKVAGKNAIGVLMTGMGRDGARGLLEMKNAGAKTIGQDEKTSVVYGMPKVAYDIGAVMWQVPLGQISQKLYYILDKK